MSPQTEQYRAYLKAKGTVPKTRQIVMLYDAAIRSLRQAAEAIKAKRIEERYHLTVKATDVLSALQSSIDFENGGKISSVLHGFYTNMTRRIIALNFEKDNTQAETLCHSIVDELKEMRHVWDTIDISLGKNSDGGAPPADTNLPPPKPDPDTVSISA